MNTLINEGDRVIEHIDRDFVHVPSNRTIAQTSMFLRKNYMSNPRPNSQTLEDEPYIYIVEYLDDIKKLKGMTTYKALLLANDRSADISKIMVLVENMIYASPNEDQEVASKLLTEHKLFSIPIIDDKGIIEGVLTADDAANIIKEEIDEDIAKQSAQTALEDNYLKTGPLKLFTNRVLWLMILFIAEFFTSTILQTFENELEKCIALSFFIPLIISVGGNSSSQVVGTLIRVTETEGVSIKNALSVVWKEMRTATMLGIVTAFVGFTRAWMLGVGISVMITVAVAILIEVIWAAIMASLIPLILKKINIDPAVVSSALMATLTDSVGLLILMFVAQILVF